MDSYIYHNHNTFQFSPSYIPSFPFEFSLKDTTKNNTMSKVNSFSFLLSFLMVLSYFVIEIHGNKQVKALDKLQKEKYRGNSQIDRSDEFEVEEVVNYDDIVHSQEGLKEKDRIVRLPGQPLVKFSQFGGYVTLDKSAGSAFYYYFVEAHNSKETLPLLLWLNGGKN